MAGFYILTTHIVERKMARCACVFFFFLLFLPFALKHFSSLTHLILQRCSLHGCRFGSVSRNRGFKRETVQYY